MQADKLEGIHAEPEFCVVGAAIIFNSRVHFTPSQSKTKQTDEKYCLCNSVYYNGWYFRDRGILLKLFTT